MLFIFFLFFVCVFCIWDYENIFLVVGLRVLKVFIKIVNDEKLVWNLMCLFDIFFSCL